MLSCDVAADGPVAHRDIPVGRAAGLDAAKIFSLVLYSSAGVGVNRFVRYVERDRRHVLLDLSIEALVFRRQERRLISRSAQTRRGLCPGQASYGSNSAAALTSFATSSVT